MRMNVLIAGLAGLIFSGSVLAQIPNPSFETWSSGQPDGWSTSNVPGFGSPITQSSTAHSGTSSARGDVIALPIGGNLNAILQSGAGGKGFPISQRYATCSGYYQFSGTSGDMFGVNVGFWSQGGAIAVGAQKIGSTSGWTQFTATMAYTSGATPDTAVIQFLIVGPTTGADVHVGSWFLVDDLTFSGTNGVQDLANPTPVHYSLAQNYPNPFNPSTMIVYELPHASNVSLRVYNALGQEVAMLVDESKAAGVYSVVFDGSSLSSGVYFCRLHAGTFNSTKRLLLLK